MEGLELSFGQNLELKPPSDCYDFRAWAQYFSKLNSLNIASISGSKFEDCVSNFKKFLHTFPWLYAYWDKLANFLWSSRCELSLTQNIYLSALSKTTLYYSIDMWLCYIKFFKANLPQTEQDKMRQIHTASLDAVGRHYCSGNLWRLALNYEDENRRSTFPLLAKSITCPTSELKQFWAELQLILPKVSLSDFQLFIANKEKSISELLLLFDETIVPPSQASELAQQLADDTEERSNCINILAEIYNASLDKISSRCQYEENINRHFFHFNAPDEVQISNWERYTSFLEDQFNKTHSKESFDDVVLTFERALIPCAFIDNIWIRYANFLEDNISLNFATNEDVREVYQRIPFKVMPGAKIIYAEFEEVYSPNENAPKIYSEMAQSNNAEQIIASATYQIRSHSLLDTNDNNNDNSYDGATEILRKGRDRLLEKGDMEGASAVAAALLDFNESSDNISGAVYITKYAKKYSAQDPNETSNYLFNAIFNSTSSTIEDKLSFLRLYLELMGKHGIQANFQLNLETEYQRLKNKLVWNENYFDQKFLLSKQWPELKMKEWLQYLKEIK